MEVRLEPAKETDRELFRQWTREDGLERLTCRPVADGRRVPPSQESETLAGYRPERAGPVGKVEFFGFNPRNRSMEIGYVVAPAFRRQGVAFSLLTAALNLKFRGSELNKVHAQTGSFNTASIRLLEKLGFRRDAVLREHHEQDGRLLDDLVYSLLRREWEAQSWSREE